MSFRAHQISGQLAQEHAALGTTVLASTRAFPDIATAGSRVVRMRSGSTANRMACGEASAALADVRTA